MQMALLSAARYSLLLLLTRALPASGFSLRSSQNAVDIPDDSRVTTVHNIQSGVGVVRPAPPPTAAAAGGGDAAGGAAAGGTPIGMRVWKVEAMFEMSTTAPMFTDEYASSTAGFALTVADRLKWATGVPLSRFAFYFPGGGAGGNVLFCESSTNEGKTNAMSARYTDAKNTSFECAGVQHTINATVVALLQNAAKSKAPAGPLAFEVGVYPASGVGGDIKSGAQVVEEIVRAGTGEDEPVRKLQKNGMWTYQAGAGVKFHGLFPATLVAMPGAALASPREVSLPLGPNPGGQGAEPPPTLPPGMKPSDKDAAAAQTAMVADVDAVVAEATQINGQVKNSLQELKDSLARASAVHNAWMNDNVYELPHDLVG